MSQTRPQQTKIQNWSKALIVLSLLLFAAAPFIFIYSQKLIYLLECGSKAYQKDAGWNQCDSLGFGRMFYALGLVLIVLVLSALLMLFATRSRKTK
jgi:hypothetical protein